MEKLKMFIIILKINSIILTMQRDYAFGPLGDKGNLMRRTTKPLSP